jgi:hypothetical protein
MQHVIEVLAVVQLDSEIPSSLHAVLFSKQEYAADGLLPPVRRKPRGRLLPSGEGRCLLRWKGRWSWVNRLVNTFVKKRNVRQVLAQNRRQMFVGGFYAIQKPPPSTDHHCSLVLKPLVKPCEDDGS